MKKNMKFETAIKELERVVEALESQDLPLEKALSTFEQGVRLARHCSKLLDEAEARIRVLTEGSGNDRADLRSDEEPDLESFAPEGSDRP